MGRIRNHHIVDGEIGPEKMRGRGAPLLFGARYGTTHYVQSTHDNAGDDDEHGDRPEYPFATIGYGVGSAKVNAGSDTTLLCGPGHTEALATAAKIDAAKSGLRIIGAGYGSLMPKITFTADLADFKISAANVEIAGIAFECDKTTGSHVRMIDVAAAYAWIHDCLFLEGATTEQSLANIILTDAAADYCTIEHNRMISLTANASHAIAIDAVVDGLRIVNNWINGDYADACIHSAAAHLNCLIAHNFLRQMQAADHALEFTVAATGLLAYNAYLSSIAAPAGVDPGSCDSIENYHGDAINTSGILAPVAT